MNEEDTERMKDYIEVTWLETHFEHNIQAGESCKSYQK
jgi:hypothetical protein